jgi:two-component sensor histidine kinase
VITLVAIVAFLFLQTAEAEQAARNQARLTNAVLAELRTALLDGVNAETGHRGFLLTGETQYLDSYDAGLRDWPQRIDRVNALTGFKATSTKIENVKQLRALADAKRENMRQAVELAQAGDHAGAVAIVRNGYGKRMMEEYRRVTAALEAEEAAILEAALKRAERIESRNEPLLAALILLILLLIGILFWLERAAVKGVLAAQEAETMRRARDRADLMSRELNHRVKNLFSVILSMIGLAGRGHTEIAAALTALRDRVYALSVAHTITQGAIGQSVASLDALLRSTLAPHNPRGGRIEINGEDVVIDAKCVTPLGLVFHELATNAVKYGALSDRGGKLNIGWTQENGPNGVIVRLIWAETRVYGTTPPDTEGFGSTMILASTSQLGGDLERKWESDGLTVVLVFPITDEANSELNDDD